MTDELIELGRRAVACKGWRWMPGMLTISDERMSDEGWPQYDVLEYGSSGVAECVKWNGKPNKGALPDLRDPATLGCLLALVREVWGDACACVLPVDYGPGGVMWVCRLAAGGRSLTARHWPTEAEALVAALELLMIDLTSARVELLHELSAENTRLRNEIEKARQEERASIVAHLRRDYLTRDTHTAAFFADAIEARHDRWKP